MMVHTMEARNLYQPTPSAESGFWARLGLPSRGAELHKALHRGFPYQVFRRLVELSELDRKELARVTAIAPATLQRRSKAGRFSPDESDRLYRFAQVFKAALDLFDGDEAMASHWLTHPVQGLGHRCPVEMLTTSAETQDVMDLIGRLEHGVAT
jgi:putative toxin-antitoxin system antitoxin component (TIGR02293 family)